MNISIREVPPEEFATYLAGTSPRSARLVMAPVSFPRAFFVAHSADRTLAGLGVSQSIEMGRTGGIGFLTGEKYALIDLIRHAEVWLKQKGARRVVGPIAYSTWFPYRVRLFQNGEIPSPTFAWEPNQPRGQEDVWPASGFSVLETYSSRALSGLQGFADGHAAGLERARSENFQFSSFQDEVITEKSRGALIDDLFDLTMESFAETSFFQPITRDEFRNLYVIGLGEISDLSCSFIMRDAELKPAAFNFAFIDQGYLVFKTLAVAKRLRGRGMSNGVLALSSQAALAKNVENMLHALIRQGNKSENFGEGSKLLWEHRYGLFAKSI